MIAIDTGLPLQVRDTLLKKQGIAVGLDVARPVSDQMNKYQADQTAKALATGDYGISPLASQALQGIAKSAPDYRRNRAKICSFWVKGNCNRGDSCPFRHEKSDHADITLAAQNIQDRYYGTEDPFAKKILARVNDRESAQTTGPEVSTLWVSGLDPAAKIEEKDIKDHFYAFGEIVKIRLVAASKCAFVEFAAHEQALNALESLRNNLVIRGTFLKLAWAKGRTVGRVSADRTYGSLDQPRTNAAPPPPGFVPYDPTGPGAPPPGAAGPLGWAPMYYPSMNPQRMGSFESGASSQQQKDSHHNKGGPRTRSRGPAQVEEPEEQQQQQQHEASNNKSTSVKVSEPSEEDIPAGGRVKRSAHTEGGEDDPRQAKKAKA